MSGMLALLLAGFSGLVGILVGATSIGAVLLVPFLTYFAGIDVHAAIGAAMFSYIFAGAAGAWFYSRRGSIQWSIAGWLIVGAMPGAFAGSVAKSAASGPALEGLIGLLLLFAAYTAMRPVAGRGSPGRVMAKPVLVALGGLTGFGSAMSGTGGPLILLPILLWLNVPVISAIGVAQAVQLPIALLATGGNFLSGEVALLIGSVIALALIAGIAAGAALAHALSPSALKRGVAWVVLVVGIGILARLFAAQFAMAN
jgi:uncharacterized membrane protein YfcA